jgi:hypothetical protein
MTKGNLTSRIGRNVSFGAPEDVQTKGGGRSQGLIIDEVWADPAMNTSEPHPQPCDKHCCWGDYAFCSQLIRWNDGTHSIRLAYYRRRCGEDFWKFASQTTVNAEWPTIKALCELTLKKVGWFTDTPQISN